MPPGVHCIGNVTPTRTSPGQSDVSYVQPHTCVMNLFCLELQRYGGKVGFHGGPMWEVAYKREAKARPDRQTLPTSWIKRSHSVKGGSWADSCDRVCPQ